VQINSLRTFSGTNDNDGETLQKQAEQARQEDLLTAVSLARRADQLAQDLLGRLP